MWEVKTIGFAPNWKHPEYISREYPNEGCGCQIETHNQFNWWLKLNPEWEPISYHWSEGYHCFVVRRKLT